MIRRAIFICAAVFLAIGPAHAGPYDENAYFKEYISDKGKDTVIAVNRDTGEVGLLWSEKDTAWIKPDEERQAELQEAYNKKLQLREMQREMDRMHDESMFDRNEDNFSR